MRESKHKDSEPRRWWCTSRGLRRLCSLVYQRLSWERLLNECGREKNVTKYTTIRRLVKHFVVRKSYQAVHLQYNRLILQCIQVILQSERHSSKTAVESALERWCCSWDRKQRMTKTTWMLSDTSLKRQDNKIAASLSSCCFNCRLWRRFVFICCHLR